MNPANASASGEPPTRPPAARRRRRWLVLAGVIAAISVVTLAFTCVLPIIVEQQLNALAARHLAGLAVSFDGTRWAFPWRACVVGLRADARSHDLPILAFDRVCLDLGSLLRAGEHLTVSQLAVEHGFVRLDRLLAGCQPAGTATSPLADTQTTRPGPRQPQQPTVQIDGIVIADVALRSERWPGDARLALRVVGGELAHIPGEPWTYRIRNCELELAGGNAQVSGELDLARPTYSRLQAAWHDLELDARLIRAPSAVRSLVCTAQVEVHWPEASCRWPHIVLAAEYLTATGRQPNQPPLVAREVSLMVHPAPQKADRLEVQLEQMQLAGGQVRARVTYQPLEGGRVRGQGDFEGVRLEPVYRLLLPANEPLRAVAAGSFSIEAAVSGEPAWSAGGRMELTDAELARLPLMQAILDHLRARRLVERLNPLAFRNAQVHFRLQPEGIDLGQTEVRSPAVALYFEGRVGWEQELDLTVTAGVIPGLRKALPHPLRAAEEWFSRVLRENLVPLRVTGTLRRPVVVPLPGGKLTRQSMKFFGNLTRRTAGE